MPKWEPATNELDEPVVSTNRVTITFDLFLDEDMSDFEDLEETDQNNFKSHWASFEFGTSLNTNGMFSFDPNFENNPEDVRKLGVEIALNLCNDLIDAGVPGIHFYTMNSSTATSEIFESLQDRR